MIMAGVPFSPSEAMEALGEEFQALVAADSLVELQREGMEKGQHPVQAELTRAVQEADQKKKKRSGSDAPRRFGEDVPGPSGEDGPTTWRPAEDGSAGLSSLSGEDVSTWVGAGTAQNGDQGTSQATNGSKGRRKKKKGRGVPRQDGHLGTGENEVVRDGS